MKITLTEWENCGHFFVTCADGVGTIKNKWWYPPRLIGMELCDYINKLLSFGAKRLDYNAEKDVLYFYFDSLSEARKFKNWINAEMRKAVIA